jgi:hypothetical protein
VSIGYRFGVRVTASRPGGPVSSSVRRQRIKTALIATAIIVDLAATIGLVYWLQKKNSSSSKTPTTTTPSK